MDDMGIGIKTNHGLGLLATSEWKDDNPLKELDKRALLESIWVFDLTFSVFIWTMTLLTIGGSQVHIGSGLHNQVKAHTSTLFDCVWMAGEPAILNTNAAACI